jgi:thiosulfate dehydrogenase (quinone) large subunit
MKKKYSYSSLQLTALVVLRFVIGWHILYEGIAKLLNPQWTSLGFLQQSHGILSGFSGWVISNPGVLSVVDILNTWGLIAIGLGLLLGLFSRAAAVFGAALIFIYYLNSPPLIGVEYAMPVDGNYLIVDKTLIEAVALCVLALFPTSKIFGLDAIRGNRLKNRKGDL